MVSFVAGQAVATVVERIFCAEIRTHGRLAGPRCKAITREVNRLCNEARGVAGELVDALGIPDGVLGAPIGQPDGQG